MRRWQDIITFYPNKWVALVSVITRPSGAIQRGEVIGYGKNREDVQRRYPEATVVLAKNTRVA